MAAADNPRIASFAGRHPELSQGTPGDLRIRRSFEEARDPLVKAQWEALEKSEAQRREDSGDGSSMVKKDHPFPELRPDDHYLQKRSSFNEAWLREARAARMKQYAAEQIVRGHGEPQDRPQPGWQR